MRRSFFSSSINSITPSQEVGIMRKRLVPLALLALLAALFLTQCAVPAPPQAPAPAAAPAEEAGPTFKLASIFPGVITDADYNTLAYIGTTEVGKDLGIEVAYSESVAVPDVDRVMREYIADGYNIIFTHGGQFFNQTLTLAAEFPDVYFIAEGDAPAENPPENVWVIDRNFHVGFYGVGALAAMITETGKVGYLGGLTLPFSYAEVHAMQQAIDDLGLDVELKPVWVGNFNDPTKARELADAMIAEDVDVIVGSLNLGMLGVFEAVKSAPRQVWVTAKYTDKSNFAPDNYVTSLLYDFAGPLKDIVSKIMAGERGGYYPLGFDTGVSLQEPKHVSDEVKQRIDEITQKLISGEITVIKNTEPIE
ncbi:MAG: BMP family ABC transporter substrate-binding protein [Caldilineae bacterium]|nr:MAG: BMP family ABC transporter substrate-binding protein [Caldilineae bacterium]